MCAAAHLYPSCRSTRAPTLTSAAVASTNRDPRMIESWRGRVVALPAVMSQVLRALRFDRQRAFRALSLGAFGQHSRSWRVAHGFFVLSFH
jgi:hypothetical protein